MHAGDDEFAIDWLRESRILDPDLQRGVVERGRPNARECRKRLDCDGRLDKGDVYFGTWALRLAVLATRRRVDLGPLAALFGRQAQHVVKPVNARFCKARTSRNFLHDNHVKGRHLGGKHHPASIQLLAVGAALVVNRAVIVIVVVERSARWV